MHSEVVLERTQVSRAPLDSGFQGRKDVLVDIDTEKPYGNKESKTYPRHPEVPKYASSFSTLYTSISYLGRTCVAVHLGQLELCGGAYSWGEAEVADDVTEGLSRTRESAYALHIHDQSQRGQLSRLRGH